MMLEKRLKDRVKLDIDDCKMLNWPDSRVALNFVQHIEDFDDIEILDVYKSLDKSIKKEIKIKLDKYMETKSMCIITSSGAIDVSELLDRLSKIIGLKNI